MERKRILWIGDAVVPTGFATVNHNIIDRLPPEKYDIWMLGINYWGDPNITEGGYRPRGIPVFPAFSPQTRDVYGYGRIPELLTKYKFDAIFILNDIWVIKKYLEVIRETVTKSEIQKPKIVIYYPVDGGGYTKEWFSDFDMVDQAVVYTEFGKKVSLAVAPDLDLKIIPHGASDNRVIYKVKETVVDLRKRLFPENPEIWNGFWILNANRNQNRKRIDVSITAFALFAKNKENVFYYHHAGLKDAGWDFWGLVKRIEHEIGVPLVNRIITTNREPGKQTIPIEYLNWIYNASDIGLNTSLGEGWGLIQTEHASVGKPQVVGAHSSLKELFHDVGVLVPVRTVLRDQEFCTKRYVLDHYDVAEALNKIYYDKELYQELSQKSEEKFKDPYYSWDTIGKMWDKVFSALWE